MAPNRITRAGFRLTRRQYDALVIAQQGRCAVCVVPCDLQIDHDRLTGLVRGLVCHRCAGTVRGLEKDRVRSELAWDYLRRQPPPPWAGDSPWLVAAAALTGPRDRR